MAKEVTIKDKKFFIVDVITGRLWQSIQRYTGQLKEGKIDSVDFTNKAIELLVTKMEHTTASGEVATITNTPDILNMVLEDDVEVLDGLSVEVASVLENNPYIKKKMT